MNGFITLSRKMIKWEWYDDSKTKDVFLHLLLLANWEDKEWHGTVIKRGQLITSIPHLMSDLKLSERKVRNALSNLQKTGEIVRQTTNRYSLITVTKYDEYQSDTSGKGQSSVSQASDKGQQLNNNNKDNKKNNNNPPLSPFGLISEKHFEPALEEALKEWVRYKKERRELYKETGFRSLLTQIENKRRELGADTVVSLIYEGMSNNYKGIPWKAGRPAGVDINNWAKGGSG